MQETPKSLDKKRADEKLLVSEMIALYCRKQHKTPKGQLCPATTAIHTVLPKPNGRGRERCTAPILSPAACIYVLLYRAVRSRTAGTGPISLDEQTSFVKRRPVCGYQAARSAPSLRQAACTSSSGASLQIRPSPFSTCAPSP